MAGDDATIDLSPVEIEILLTALDLYERRVRRTNQSDPTIHAIRVLRQRLIVASHSSRREIGLDEPGANKPPPDDS
jgi:hypothetical protein